MHICKKTQSHPFTSYWLVRFCRRDFPKLCWLQWTESGVQDTRLHHLFPLSLSLPLLSTTTFDSYRNQTCYLQIPSGSSPHLTETSCFLIIFRAPPRCFRHCTFLPLTSGRALTYTLPPKLQQQTAAQHLPRPGLPRRNAFLHSWVLWTAAKWDAWRRLFVFSCYTNSWFSVKETGFAISPRHGHLTLYTRPFLLLAPSMKWSIKDKLMPFPSQSFLSSTMAPEASRLLTA